MMNVEHCLGDGWYGAGLNGKLEWIAAPCFHNKGEEWKMVGSDEKRWERKKRNGK